MMCRRRLSSFEEYKYSYLMYEELSCSNCNKIRYVCLYKKLFTKILSCELEPRELIDIQRTVFETVLELQQEEKKCEYFNLADKIVEFRMLVTMALQIYVVGADPYNIVSLNEDLNYENDLFNPNEIEQLFGVAGDVLEESNSSFIIISDLCLGNMQLGDLLVNDNGRFTAIEVKSGEKNKNITELVLKGKANPYDKKTNKTDWRHFERFKKQWKRCELIVEHINADYYIDSQRAIVVSRYWDKDYDNFEELFANTLAEAENHLYQEVLVDDCISIISINKAAYRAHNMNLAPPCLYLMMKDLISLPLNKSEERALDKFCSRDFSKYEIFPYSAVLHDQGAVQPYLWGATDKQMIYLLEEGIEISIVINIEALFEYLRQQGFKIYPKKIYPKKGMPVPFLYEYKGKTWAMEYENCGPEGITAFTKDSIKRIACGMYTSKGLADNLKVLCKRLEVETRTLFEELGIEISND